MTAAEPKPKPKRRRGCIVLIAVVVLLLMLLVGGLFVTGSMLDERVESSVTMAFPHDPAVVWSAIQDYETNPVSATMRQETIVIPDASNAPAWKEDIGSTVITVQTMESDAPNRLVRRFEDSIVPMTADVEYVVDANGRRCQCYDEHDDDHSRRHVARSAVPRNATHRARRRVVGLSQQLAV
jgi:hypothetical protein